MSLLRMLGLGEPRDDAPVDDLVGSIRARLAGLPEARAELVAAFAGLMLRVAHADDDVSDVEARALRRLVAEHAGLDGDETEAVAAIMTGRLAGVGGIEYSHLTRVMNARASMDEKLRLVDCLYAIATADDLASLVEEAEIRAVAGALMLSHAQLIEIRRRYADQLEVLRGVRGHPHR